MEIARSGTVFDAAVAGTTAPHRVIEALALVEVSFTDLAGAPRKGSLLVDAGIAEEVQAIFGELHALAFPIERIEPVSAYGWDDAASMRANNTSAFNYRVVVGTDRVSNHALGMAIDVNPLLNPCVRMDGSVLPAGATYDPSRPGTLLAGSPAVRAFTDRGWDWGGLWPDPDWQHFSKLPR